MLAAGPLWLCLPGIEAALKPMLYYFYQLVAWELEGKGMDKVVLAIILVVVVIVAYVYWVWRSTKADEENHIEKEGQPNIWSLQYWIWKKTKEDERDRKEKEAKR